MKLFTRYFYIFLFLIIAACNGGPKEEESQIKSEKEIQIQVPDFNADSAYAYIEKQLSFGPRVPNTPAHHSCALYLENKLREYTPDVIVQVFKARAFDGSILNGQNIIASFNKENQHRILLASHWDSRPFADHDPDPKNHRKPIDGANDGASGVGILIEIARQLTTLKVNTGVDIILFDLEDYGEPEDQRSNNEDNWGLGSQYWSRNKHQVNYMPTFGILLDMVGASNATFTKEGYSMEYASDFVNKIWDVAAKIGFSRYFVNNKTGRITDDHYYVNSITGIPMVDIIQIDPQTYQFFKYWHTLGDNISVIDKNTLNAVGKTLLTVISLENKGQLQ